MLHCGHKTLSSLAGNTPMSFHNLMLDPHLELCHDNVWKYLQEVFNTLLLHHQQQPYVGIMLILKPSSPCYWCEHWIYPWQWIPDTSSESLISIGSPVMASSSSTTSISGSLWSSLTYLLAFQDCFSFLKWCTGGGKSPSELSFSSVPSAVCHFWLLLDFTGGALPWDLAIPLVVLVGGCSCFLEVAALYLAMSQTGFKMGGHIFPHSIYSTISISDESLFLL